MMLLNMDLSVLTNPSKDSLEDSVMVTSLQYSACFFDEEYVATYSVGVLSHEDKHVVALTWCP